MYKIHNWFLNLIKVYIIYLHIRIEKTETILMYLMQNVGINF